MISPKQQKRLTIRQKLFVQEYLIDMNATRAYLRAGYKVSEKVARTNGPRMLANAAFLTAIHDAIGRRLRKLEIDNDTVLQEIAKAAFANMLDYIKIQSDGSAYVDLAHLTRDQAAAIAEIHYDDTGEKGAESGEKTIRRIKFKLFNKLASLEMLGKYLKLFSDTTPATMMSPKATAILQNVLDDTITIKDAAYQITMLGLPLPEVLKIELSKMQPDPPPPDLPPEISDEELEAGYQRKKAEIDKQEKEWVAERQIEVQAIKDELKGVASFGPDAENIKERS